MSTNRKVNISIHPRLREMGESLAAEDHRDFSNEIEWLIEREWGRRQTILAANNNEKEKAEVVFD